MDEESDFHKSETPEGKRHLPQEDITISDVGSPISIQKKENTQGDLGKRKTTSIDRKAKHMTQDSKKFTCKHCRQNFSLSFSSGGLLKHLRREHADKISDEDSEAEEGLSGEPRKKMQVSNTKISDFYQPSKKVDLNDFIGKWVVQTQKPWAVVEEPAFREMITAALTLGNPSHKLPDAKQISGFVDKNFTSNKEKLLNYFRRFPGKISLTLDVWTSISQGPFLGITAHFVDESWKLHSIYLDLVYLPHPHTALLISRVVEEIIMEWGFEKKILAITTDNGANMVKAMGILVNEGKILFHNRCAAHSIQLLVNVAVKILENNKNKRRSNLEIENLEGDDEDGMVNDEEKERSLNTIEKIRKIFVLLKKSSKRMDKLKEVCKINGLEFYKPVLDVATQWDSTLDMIRRAEKIMPALKQMVNMDKEFQSYLFSEEDEKFLSSIIPFLTELEAATESASYANKPVISRTIVMYDFLVFFFEKRLESFTSSYPELSKELLSKLNQIKNNASELSYICIGLDPQIISMQEYNKHQALAREYFLNNYKTNETDKKNSGGSEKKETALSWMKRIKEVKNVEKKIESDEFSKYMTQTSFMMASESDSELDLLDWWSKSGSRFHNISLMARDFLSVQASSTKSERRWKLTKTRSSISAGKLKKTICLKSWINFFGNLSSSK